MYLEFLLASTRFRVQANTYLIVLQQHLLNAKPLCNVSDPVVRRRMRPRCCLVWSRISVLEEWNPTIQPMSLSRFRLRCSIATSSRSAAYEACALWTRTCCDNQTRVAQRSFPDDYHRFPGPRL
jgi:hypothetical protein